MMTLLWLGDHRVRTFQASPVARFSNQHPTSADYARFPDVPSHHLEVDNPSSSVPRLLVVSYENCPEPELLLHMFFSWLLHATIKWLRIDHIDQLAVKHALVHARATVGQQLSLADTVQARSRYQRQRRTRQHLTAWADVDANGREVRAKRRLHPDAQPIRQRPATTRAKVEAGGVHR
jgi:hypothetical protein